MLIDDMKHSEIVVSRVNNNYINKEDLSEDIGTFITLLTKYGYECKVFDDDSDIYVIQFNESAKLNYGNPILKWVTPEEADMIETYRMHMEDEENEEIL